MIVCYIDLCSDYSRQRSAALMNEPKNKTSFTLEEAINYLKKLDEWVSVQRLERDLIIAWANFLKDRELAKEKVSADTSKLPAKNITRPRIKQNKIS